MRQLRKKQNKPSMTIRLRIKNLLEELTGTHIYRAWPRGVDLLQDIRYNLPTFQADVVFDVGAHAGQSASKFLRWFPESQIYCFEPAADTFNQLEENLKGSTRVHSFQLALGEYRRKGRLVNQGPSLMFRLLDPSKEVPPNSDLSTEEVYVETIDDFCRDGKINQISYLKVDTEGGDVAVLKGASTMLREHRIDLVEVEAGMNSRNEWHVPFEVLKHYLEARRYFLFGVYEQKREWPTKEPHLRRTNLVFISEPTIRANRQ